MFIFTGVRSAQIVSHDEQQQQQKARFRSRRRSLVKSVFEKQRKEENLDYTYLKAPLKQYILLSNLANTVVLSHIFNAYILVCIIVAGVLVGIETYDGMQTIPAIIACNQIVLYSFVAEIVLKIMSEGMGPQLYFIGSDWRWNLFDFFIVLVSLLPVGASQVKILRLIRLLRVAKVFRKIPQLQVIIMGLYGGLESIMYIFVLMFLTFYMFAIAGIIFFRQNDPWHFHSIEISMLTLLRVATLDNWGQVLYVNYYGCDVYHSEVYTNIPEENNPHLGGMTYCGTPLAQPYLTVLYFVVFIVMSAFCILSLFIGAVSLAMAESMIKVRDEKEERRIAEQKLKIDEQIAFYEDYERLDRKMKRRLKLIELAFTGMDLEDKKERIETTWKSPKSFYRFLSLHCGELADSKYFQNLVTFVIIAAGMSVGMATDKKLSVEWETQLHVLDTLIQFIFVLEASVKIIAEEFRPWRYFRDNWNKFDFFVVAAAFLPTGSGSTITILRLLRLLRVLKLMRALPQLQVLVTALLSGFSSIGFISILLLIFYYFFAIIGMVLFQANDPWHFGSLEITMICLFQSTTLDNWSSIMYTGLYGCKQFSGSSPTSCTTSTPQFVLSTLFWVVFILMGALVLLTLFIGVVNMSMEQAKADQDEQAIIDGRALRIATAENLDRIQVELYKLVFEIVDFTSSCKIGRDEMRFGLKIAGLSNLSDSDFEDIWSRVDKDKSSGIDFSEFLEFMLDLKVQLQSIGLAAKVGKDGKTIKRRTFEQFNSQKSTGGAEKASKDPALTSIKEKVPTSLDSPLSSPDKANSGSKYSLGEVSKCNSLDPLLPDIDEEVSTLFHKTSSVDRLDLREYKLKVEDADQLQLTSISHPSDRTEENRSARVNSLHSTASPGNSVSGILKTSSSGQSSSAANGVRVKPRPSAVTIVPPGEAIPSASSSLTNIILSRNRVLPESSLSDSLANPVEMPQFSVNVQQSFPDSPEVDVVSPGNLSIHTISERGPLLEYQSDDSVMASSSQLQKRAKPKSSLRLEQEEKQKYRNSQRNENLSFDPMDSLDQEQQQLHQQYQQPIRPFAFPSVSQLASLPEPMVMIMMPQSHAASYYRSVESLSRTSSPVRNNMHSSSPPQRQFSQSSHFSNKYNKPKPDEEESPEHSPETPHFLSGEDSFLMDYYNDRNSPYRNMSTKSGENNLGGESRVSRSSVSPSGRKICKSRICSI